MTSVHSDVARVVQRLAVLLGAGVAPAAAWGYLDDPSVGEVASAATSGQSIPAAIAAVAGGAEAPASPWQGLAIAWAVATEAGAPLAPTLREFAASLRDLAQAEREISVALAAPAATARLVLVLPAIGLLFGMLLGFNTLGTLLSTPVGWVCLALGGGLMIGAARWNARMVKAARVTDSTPGLQFDLLAIAVSGGGSLDRARATVASAMTRYSGVPPAEIVTDDGIDAVLELSRRAGVPAAELLRSEAIELRRAARADAQERAERLSVRLMIPLGVCVLPAFMLLSVVPLLISVVSSTSIRW
ncbi:MAG TPA: type II secretion system F family protein [Galbitalea sp.]